MKQVITIEGEASAGSQVAGNVATFSGTCTINMGDGSLPLPGVPFTATITTDGNDQGTIGLVFGSTTPAQRDDQPGQHDDPAGFHRTCVAWRTWRLGLDFEWLKS